MEILVLANGDANTRRSWSGISKSVVDELRQCGHQVHVGDVDLYGSNRWLAAGATFTPDFRRWRSLYHLGEAPFRMRTARAQQQVTKLGKKLDFILQFGCTFAPYERGDLPYALYCDSNILVSERHRQTQHTDAAPLTEQEVEEIAERESSVYQGAAAIFTTSEVLRRSFLYDFGISPERVHNVRAGPNLDLDQIPVRPERSGPPTVLFVGKDYERKGGDLLVRAMRQVRREMPDAWLVIAGPDELTLNEPNTRVLGYLNKDTLNGWATLREAYASADVFCLPSRFEPFGIAFLEAMSFGLPCVGPNTMAVPEMIEEGVTGYTVPVDEEDLLAERLLFLLGDRDRARRMGFAGRIRVEELFTWPAVVDRMMSVLAPQVITHDSVIEVA